MTTTQLLEGLARCKDAHGAFAANFSILPPAYSAFKDELKRIERALRLWEQNHGRSGQFPRAAQLWDLLGDGRVFFEAQNASLRQGTHSRDFSGRSGSQVAILEELCAIQQRLANAVGENGNHSLETFASEPVTARTCQVKIKIDKVSFAAHSYALSKRCLLWRNDQGAVLLEHQLPTSTRKCFPYTQHRIFGKPFTATFLEPQPILLKGTKDRAVTCRPQYSFLFESDYQLFQSDIRGRDILHEFHVSTIASKSSRGGADAHNEVVKIWEAPSGSADRSISFPAAHSTTTKDFELPLKWFCPPVTPARSNTVRLELASDHSSNDSSSLKSKFNLRKKTPTATANSAGSIRSVNTATASAAYAPAEWLARLGYLEFKFTVPSAIPAFIAAVSDAYAPHFPSRVPSLYSAGSGSPSTTSTAWSASPLSFKYMSQRPSERRSSVASTGTGPLSPSGMALPDAAMGMPSAKDTEMDLDLDLDSAEFTLPSTEARLGGLVIREEEGNMSATKEKQAQTPSSLLGAAR